MESADAVREEASAAHPSAASKGPDMAVPFGSNMLTLTYFVVCMFSELCFVLGYKDQLQNGLWFAENSHQRWRRLAVDVSQEWAVCRCSLLVFIPVSIPTHHGPLEALPGYTDSNQILQSPPCHLHYESEVSSGWCAADL